MKLNAAGTLQPTEQTRKSVNSEKQSIWWADINKMLHLHKCKCNNLVQCGDPPSDLNPPLYNKKQASSNMKPHSIKVYVVFWSNRPIWQVSYFKKLIIALLKCQALIINDEFMSLKRGDFQGEKVGVAGC